MNRRWFLKGALGAAAGVAISGELIEALAPRPKIFLPPRMRVVPQWVLDHSDIYDTRTWGDIKSDIDRLTLLNVGDSVTFQHVTDGPGGPPKWFVVVDGGQVAQYAVRR